jgi:hypothetical protein
MYRRSKPLDSLFSVMKECIIVEALTSAEPAETVDDEIRDSVAGIRTIVLETRVISGAFGAQNEKNTDNGKQEIVDK